jgi:hypothetical protein
MSGAGSAEEPGIVRRHDQGCVEPSRGLEDPILPIPAPTGVQLAPTSLKLMEGKFCELRLMRQGKGKWREVCSTHVSRYRIVRGIPGVLITASW